MTFCFSIKEGSNHKNYYVDSGSSLFFVGANGGGKTRLAVSIEEQLGEKAHRISAHRALSLNPEVAKISEAAAVRGIRYGSNNDHINIGNRIIARWGNKAATNLLNDFDFLIQALFAEQSNTSLETHNNARLSNGKAATETNFEKLSVIWDRILPHRKLHVSGDDIKVSITGSEVQYAANEMSDGERAVFYLIGQTLVAAPNSLIIFDEPELHIHRGIIARLWDELEAARPDCGMIIISHDLEFVSSRPGQKFVLKSYTPNTGWIIEPVPEDSGFPEDIVTLILGSRKPILFIEGTDTSLDKALYRACYPDWTIIPRGSCSNVIHAVQTMRSNASLIRVTCSGIVDADGYDETEIANFVTMGISVLPVSEIENIFLLPDVIDEIAKTNSFQGEQLIARRNEILDKLFAHASCNKNQADCVMRYCKRRIDRILKNIDLSNANDIETLALSYSTETSSLNVNSIADTITQAIREAIQRKDAATLLKWYDNKGLMNIACSARATSKASFEQWIIRSLNNNSTPDLTAVIRRYLPTIRAI